MGRQQAKPVEDKAKTVLAVLWGEGFVAEAARRGDPAGVEPGRRERDRDVRSPLGRSFDTDSLDVVSVEQIDRGAVAGRGVVEGLVDELDAMFVDDADGEGVLVGFDSPDWWCHAVCTTQV